jgi:hypothetical protein
VHIGAAIMRAFGRALRLPRRFPEAQQHSH